MTIDASKIRGREWLMYLDNKICLTQLDTCDQCGGIGTINTVTVVDPDMRTERIAWANSKRFNLIGSNELGANEDGDCVCEACQ